MSFEELYEKYKNGQTTPEETKYVEDVLEQAKNLPENVGDVKKNEPEQKQIEKLKKKFKIKTLIKILVSCFVSIVIAGGITCGVLFGISLPAAKNSVNYTQEQAISIATSFINENSEIYGTNEQIKKCEKEFEMVFPQLKNSYYKYELEMSTDKYNMKIKVNAQTGAITCEIKFDSHHKEEKD